MEVCHERPPSARRNSVTDRYKYLFMQYVACGICRVNIDACASLGQPFCIAYISRLRSMFSNNNNL